MKEQTLETEPCNTYRPGRRGEAGRGEAKGWPVNQEIKPRASSVLKIMKSFQKEERGWSVLSDAAEKIKDNEG